MPGREEELRERRGLPLAAMPEGHAKSRARADREYAGNLRGELAEAEVARVRQAGVEQVHFAWGGPLEEGHPNYWRLHGPLTLIEYDNTQNDANHIHSVWHDLERNSAATSCASTTPTATPTGEGPGLNGSDPAGPICRTDWPAFSLSRGAPRRGGPPDRAAGIDGGWLETAVGAGAARGARRSKRHRLSDGRMCALPLEGEAGLDGSGGRR